VVLLVLLFAAQGVTVPTGKTTTLTTVPQARIAVPAGGFRMGATADDVRLARLMCEAELRASGALLLEASPRCGSRFDAETPQADVYVPAFALDRTEVTVAAYAACVRQGACRPALELRLAADQANTPIERVTWYEAAAYCRAQGGRLPSEAEWEKAARGLSRRTWPWGHDWQDRRANHGRSQRMAPGSAPGSEDDTLEPGDGFAGAAPVGAYTTGASPYGALDMAGNVWEWTAGYFSREAPQTVTRFDPRGPLYGDERTVRGGSYRRPPSDLRLTRRLGLAPGERMPGVGFRCAYDGE